MPTCGRDEWTLRALSAELSPSLPRVKVDPGQIEKVIVNLASNARDAMPDGGRLTIATAEAELSPAYAAAHPGVRPGRTCSSP